MRRAPHHTPAIHRMLCSCPLCACPAACLLTVRAACHPPDFHPPPPPPCPSVLPCNDHLASADRCQARTRHNRRGVCGWVHMQAEAGRQERVHARERWSARHRGAVGASARWAARVYMAWWRVQRGLLRPAGCCHSAAAAAAASWAPRPRVARLGQSGSSAPASTGSSRGLHGCMRGRARAHQPHRQGVGG